MAATKRGPGLVPTNSTLFQALEVDRKRLAIRNSWGEPFPCPPPNAEMLSHLVTHMQAGSGHTERTVKIKSVLFKIDMILLAAAC